jgi:hypothetical protein
LCFIEIAADRASGERFALKLVVMPRNVVQLRRFVRRRTLAAQLLLLCDGSMAVIKVVNLYPSIS